MPQSDLFADLYPVEPLPEKTIKCKVCGKETGPVFGMCPDCVRKEDEALTRHINVDGLREQIIRDSQAARDPHISDSERSFFLERVASYRQALTEAL